MKTILVLSLIGFLVSLTSPAPLDSLYVRTTRGAPVENERSKAITYLIKYSSLTEETKNDPIAFEHALKAVQRDGGLPETGILDVETIKLMELPRCDFGTGQLAQEYRIVAKWRKSALTYRIVSYTSDMSIADQEEEIRRAFKVWSDNSGLTFTKTNGNANIEIMFARRFHGDGDPFDGPGGTLAHAYFPFAGGDCHLDDDENFTFNASRGINLFQVVAHELGHSLGLDHTSDQTALMAAFYRGYQRNFQLGNDDIRGIQSMYGPNTNTEMNPNQPNTVFPGRPVTTRFPYFPGPQPTQNPNPPPRPTQPSSGESYCRDSSLDAIFTTSDQRTYGFKGDIYYRFADRGLEASYPRLIRQYWPGVPDNLDAAMSLASGPSGREEIWFFKGSQIFYYGTNGQPIRGPQDIRQAIRGLPNDIDAIFTWSGNGKVYVMKGSQYYKLMEDLKQIEPNYPRNIDVWTQRSDYAFQQALSGGIDAAFQYKNGRTYFFKGQEYYRLTDRPLQFDSDYPRMIAYWWFDCNN